MKNKINNTISHPHAQFPSSIKRRMKGIFSYRLFNHNMINFRSITVYSIVTLKPSKRCERSSVPKWIMIHQYWQVCIMPVVNIHPHRNNNVYDAFGQIPTIRRPICTEKATIFASIILRFLRDTVYQIYIEICIY